MTQVGKTLFVLAVFAVAAAGVGLYAWRQVYETDRQFAAQKANKPENVAPRLLGGLDAGAVVFRSLKVTFEGHTTVLERVNTEWQLTSPVHARADQGVVEAVVSALQHTAIKAALDENPDAATVHTFGLDEPQFAVEAVALVGNRTETIALVGGGENTFDGSVYVRRNHEPAVYAAEGGVRYAMARSAFDLRDKATLALDDKNLVTLTVNSHENAWSVEHTGGQWSFRRPPNEVGDPAQFTALLFALTTTRGQRFLDDAGPLFDRPLVDAKATATTGEVRLRFARNDAGVLLVRRDDQFGGTIAEVNIDQVPFDRSAASLRDTAVMRFSREQVTRIELKSPQGLWVLEKEPGTVEAWRLGPTNALARTFKVAALLWTLNGLKARSWANDKPPFPARLGFDEAARSITVLGAHGTLAKLIIGHDAAETPGQVYVLNGRGQVALVDQARLAEVPWTGSELEQPAAP